MQPPPSQPTASAAMRPDPIAIVAPDDAAGLRADRFLADAIGTLSRTRVKGLIEAGHATRDGIRIDQPAEPIRPGALYELYEDRDLLVLDKPAGLVVHPAPGNEDGTLVNALLAHCGDSLPGIGGERRPGIVHRLDRDTTGVMVVAKTEQALATLSAAFAARDLDRAYLALAWGVPNPAAGEVDKPIGRDPRDRKRMAVVARGGKQALTRYRIERVAHTAVSLLEARLATGRTHQIRVHLAAIGHPVVGDPVYLRRIPAVSRSVPDPARALLLDFPRQALHATLLGFRHPRTGQSLEFRTAPPADFQALVAALAL